jgi:enediyne biosynthesis protein E4
VSQPFERKARIKAPGKLDASLKEWWVENPWDIPAEGKNLSCFERKRTYLNVKGGNFVDVSYLTGADSDGDGRSAVAGDFRNNGQQDVVLRQSGGGPLLMFENHFPIRHYLEVSLRGNRVAGQAPTSNRQGIGARLIAEVNGRQVVRELFPHNTFVSQAPLVVHFGLAEDAKVDRLVIRWPSGNEQILKDVPGDQHIVVEEGNPLFEKVVPGHIVQP